MSQDHNSLPPTRGEGQGQRWTAGHTFVSSQLAVFDDRRVVATVGSAIGRDDDRTRADARLIAAAPELLEFARAHEAWEASLIRNGRWELPGAEGLPALTDELYDAMMELQAKRNAVIAKVALPQPHPPGANSHEG